MFEQRFRQHEKRNRIFYILSFLLPALIVYTVMILQEIFPFGDKTVLVWDLEIQYWKLYSWFHDLLHGETGLFYSFSQALGGNMYAPAAYHVLCCPFNWLVYFFDTAHIAAFFSIITILKIATCGLAFYIYGTKRFQIGHNCFLLLFSTAYALMEYNVSLCSNIHFIDAIYILPIVALGVYYLVNHGKKMLFYLAALYAIAVNWYTGYMVCLFSVFYCIFELFLHFQMKYKWKDCLKGFLRYCAVIALSTCTSAVILFPSILASMSGKGKLELQYLKPHFHCDPLYILRSLFITSEGNVTYEQPAIYVSALVLVFVLMMYIDKRFDKRKKLACFLMSLFIFVSFSFVPLEVMWTILKKTYSFHFRYAFVFSFLLVMSACFYLEELEYKRYSLSWKLCMGAAGCIGLYFWIQNMVEPFRGHKNTIYYCVVLLLCFGAALYHTKYGNQRVNSRIILIYIGILVLYEQVYNVNHTFSKYCISNEAFIAYVSNTDRAISKIKSDNMDDAFRLEKTFSEMTQRRAPSVPTASEGLAFAYNGISYYHSIYDAKVNDFLAYTGYCKLNAMATNYVDTNLLMDSLLGIKYVMTEHDCPSVYEKTDSEDLPEGVNVYKNEQALSFGTVVDKNVSDFEWSNDNSSFSNQQRIIRLITGQNEAGQVLEKQEYDEQFRDGKRIWNITVIADGPLYCYWKVGHKETSVYVNNTFKQRYFSRFYKNVIYLGEYKKGEHVTVSIDDTEDCSKKHGFEAYTVNLSLFYDILDELGQNSLRQVVVDGSTLTGKISVEKAGVLWLSVPYDTGWNIWLNGKKVEYKQILNCFIGIDVNAGDYDLTMKYTPPYFRSSLMVTLISVTILIVWNKKTIKK